MAISSTISQLIIAVCKAISAFFSYLLARKEENTIQQNKIDEANKKIDDACDNGTIGDLLDATKELGEARK